MDPDFRSILCGGGLGSATLTTLLEENVLNMSVFAHLREEHFEKLLPKLPIGDHAILLQLWETKAMNLVEEFPPTVRRGSSASESVSRGSSRGSSPRLGPLLPPRVSPPTPLRLSPPYKRDNSKPSSSGRTLKELSEFYKAKSLQKVNAARPRKEAPQMMMVILGGMIFDPILGRGVRKRYLHEPNPTKVEMKRDSSYEDVLKMAVSIFFEIYNPEIDSLNLADSNGLPISVASRETWTLGTFYQNNGLQPSRHKLYVVLQVNDSDTGDNDHIESNLSASEKVVEEKSSEDGSLQSSEPVVRKCTSCSRDFRTYIPETNCELSDGSSFYYSEPQNECPLCDVNHFGAFMNKDLFPELA